MKVVAALILLALVATMHARERRRFGNFLGSNDDGFIQRRGRGTFGGRRGRQERRVSGSFGEQSPRENFGERAAGRRGLKVGSHAKNAASLKQSDAAQVAGHNKQDAGARKKLGSKKGRGNKLAHQNQLRAEQHDEGRDFNEESSASDVKFMQRKGATVMDNMDFANSENRRQSSGNQHTNGFKVDQGESVDLEEFDEDELLDESMGQFSQDAASQAANERLLDAQNMRDEGFDHDNFADFDIGSHRGFGDNFGGKQFGDFENGGSRFGNQRSGRFGSGFSGFGDRFNGRRAN